MKILAGILAAFAVAQIIAVVSGPACIIAGVCFFIWISG
jgi:hypothetical protein